jgi:hypothetical protein
MTAPNMLEEALFYAVDGFHVFPLKAGDKTPPTKHGFKNATIDEGQTRKWWSQRPSANIGIATGAVITS